MNKEYHCLMPFVDGSDSFVHGYECGQVDQKIKAGDRLIKYLVHIENSAQLQMICDLYKVKCFITVIDDTWGYLTTHGNESDTYDFLDEDYDC